MSKLLRLLPLLIFTILLSGCTLSVQPTTFEQPPLSSLDNVTSTPTSTPTPTPTSDTAKLLNLKPSQKMYATIKTNLGDIKLELYPDKAPQTVANFVGLAEGTRDWVDPKGQKIKDKPLYNGTIFHRVIKGFMIQGGDPLGNGTGGPGYQFADEFDPSLSFVGSGVLAMANSGPNTNGSQFFITVADTPWLNGKHTIFGRVVGPQDTLNKIAETKTDASDKPLQDIVINQVVITRQDAQ